MYAENLISTPEAQADFYPTPKELGKKMLQGIDLGFISTVLEPSAGKGDLIRCLAEESIAQEHRYNPHTLNVDAIEIDPYIRSILKYEFGSARRQEIQHVSFDCCSMVIACIKAMCSTLSFFKKSPSHHNVTEIFPCILCECIINLLSLLPHSFIFYCTQFTQ